MNQNLRTHVLKKGCLLCLSFCLWAGSALLAQNTSISLRVKDKPLKEVLNQIETDEGYIFLYKDKTMDLERKISLDVRNASLETILRRILDEKTEFGISERQVVLYTRKEAAKTSPADTPSRKITVRGTVRDAGGNVLIGVSVVEKGTTNGTATDANGQTATVSYCLVGDDLKYVVTDAAEGRTIVEYRVTSTTVDQNLFNIPADYQILTQAEFEAAQANH